MAARDSVDAAEPFNCEAEAELFSLRNRKVNRQLTRYRRFDRGLCMKELSLLAPERRYSPATGSTGFASKSLGHMAQTLSASITRAGIR